MAKQEANFSWPGFFRAFAVLCAIVLLLAQGGQRDTQIGSQVWHVLSVYEGLTRWSIPALFMLWGMFGLERGGQKESFLQGMRDYVLPACTILLFWTLVYLLAEQLLSGERSLQGLPMAFLFALREEPQNPIWILYPLLGMYLIQPILQRFTSGASRMELIYILALCAVFGSILPLWEGLAPGNPVTAVLNRLDMNGVLGWTGCYLGGWYLRHYLISRLTEFLLYVFGITGLVFTLLGDHIVGGGRELWYQYTAPNVVLTAAAFCVLFRYVLDISDERSRRNAVHTLGSFSFGIYLVHYLWVLVLERFQISVLIVSPVFSVPLFAVALFVVSAPIAWLLNRLPVVGPYLS